MERVNKIMNIQTNNIYNHMINSCMSSDIITWILGGFHNTYITCESSRIGRDNDHISNNVDEKTPFILKVQKWDRKVYYIYSWASIKNIKISGSWIKASLVCGGRTIETIYRLIGDTFTSVILPTAFHEKELIIYTESDDYNITFDFCNEENMHLQITSPINYKSKTELDIRKYHRAEFKISQCNRITDYTIIQYGGKNSWYEIRFNIPFPTIMIYMDIPFKCRKVLCTVLIENNSYIEHIIPFYYSKNKKMWILNTQNNPFYADSTIEWMKDLIKIKFIVIPLDYYEHDCSVLVDYPIEIYTICNVRLKYSYGMCGLSF